MEKENLILRIGRYGMRKVQVVIAFMLSLCLLTACTQAEKDTETVHNSSDAAESTPSDGSTEYHGSSEIDFAGGSVQDVLNASAGMVITETINMADGKSISIDAEINVDGISRVSCYKYIPQPVTDEFRMTLFKRRHRAETWDVMEAAVFNTEDNAWEFVNPRGEQWAYRVRDSSVPAEQVFIHSRVDMEFDDSEDNFQAAVLGFHDELYPEDPLMLEATGLTEFDVVGTFEGLVNETLMPVLGNYSCSYLYIYGKESGQLFSKAVLKQVIDGMPVTVWNNISAVNTTASLYPQKIWGSFFSGEDIGLDQNIMTPEEAVEAVKSQIALVEIPSGTPTTVSQISLEYLSVISEDGEPYITPVWRFWLGNDEMERSQMSETIFAVDAMSGQLIWEKRGSFQV